MGLAELTQSMGWKKFMAKLYGLGATVVIVGAMFKIQHWPGAGPMLITGLSVEAVIFFFSAFEPLHEELDWTLVYPELAGMTDPDELDNAKNDGIVKSNAALERFDDLVGGLGGIDPTVIKNLGDSFEKLNETATGISDVSQASAVTTQYVQNVGAAAESVGGLSIAFKQSATGIQQSALAISNSSSALTAINDSSQGYATQLEGMNKNIAQLNAVYEMQLRSTNEQMQKSKAVYGDMEQLLDNMRMSVEETNRYREEMASLNRNLNSLNTIYGNMLSAMTTRG